MEFPLSGVQMLSYQGFGEMMEILLIGARFFRPTHLYAPPRGGLPIGVHLSHHLGDIPLLPTDTKTWDIRSMTEALKMRVLFVDDIVDHGRTLEKFVEQAKEFQTYWGLKYMACSLFVKPRARVRPGLFLKVIPDEDWVIFPWEDPERALADKLEYDKKREGKCL